MRERKPVFLMTGLICLFLIAGCWDNIALDERAIVAAIGVDKGKNEALLVTAQVTVATRAGGGSKTSTGGAAQEESPVKVISTEAPTMSEAARRLSRKTGRLLFFPFIEIVVVGRDLAVEGIEPVVDWVSRERELRSRTLLAVSQDTAAEIMESPGAGLQQVPAYFLSSSANVSNKYSSNSVLSDFFLFSDAVIAESKDPVVMGLTTQQVSKEKQAVIFNSAVFKNYRQVGWLTKTETRGYLWATGEQRRAIISTTLKGKEFAAFEVRGSDVDIVTDFVEGSPVITVKVWAKTNLGEIHDLNHNLEKLADINKMEIFIERQIFNEISAAVEKARELNVDIFGFGEVIRKQHPAEWKEIKDNWGLMFSEVPVEVDVKAVIRRTQQTSNPITPRDAS